MPWDEEGAAERPVRRGWCGSPASPGSKPSRTPSTLGDGGGDGLAAESARARASGRALFQPRACAPSRWAARPTPWCDAMLEGDGGHIKELYRRDQAHEQLGNDRLGLAMKDNTRLLYMWNARTRPTRPHRRPSSSMSAARPSSWRRTTRRTTAGCRIPVWPTTPERASTTCFTPASIA